MNIAWRSILLNATHTEQVQHSIMSSPLVKTLHENLKRALRGGALEEAESILSQLDREDATSAQTRGARLELLIARGRLGEAEALAKQLIELHPQSARTFFLAGRLAYRQRYYDRAETWLTEALRLHPSWRIRWWMGKTLTQAGKLDQAEAMLAPLANAHPHTLRDLAWLYERKQAYGDAMAVVKRVLDTNADDEAAKRQLVRLRSLDAAPEELIEEVETLIELQETFPEQMLPRYVRTLLERGEGEKARELLTKCRDDQWNPNLATAVGWECYHAQAHDLTWELFSSAVSHNIRSHTFLAALERVAKACGREQELAQQYEQLAPTHRNLYGRAKTLRRALEKRLANQQNS